MSFMRVRSWMSMVLIMCVAVTTVGGAGAGKASAAAGAGYSFFYHIPAEIGTTGGLPTDTYTATLSVTESTYQLGPDDTLHLLIYAADVDEDDGEWDKVTWNGVPLGAGPDEGILTGMDGEDSTTLFTLDPTSLRLDNDLKIQVTTSGWRLYLYWAQLVINGGPRTNTELATFEPVATSENSVDVNFETKIVNAGDYYLEVNLVDEKGFNHHIYTKTFPGANAGEVFADGFQVSGLPPGKYKANAMLFDYSGGAIGEVQHVWTEPVDTRAMLTDLSFAPVGGGAPIDLSPAPFSPYTKNYTGSVPYATDTISQDPDLSSALPSGSQLFYQINGSGYNPITPGAAPDLPLQVGRNTIQYMVVTPDNPDGEIYTITIDRAPKLEALPSVPETVIVPNFDGDVPSPASGYRTSVANPVESIVLTPALPADADPATKVSVSLNGGPYEELDGTLQTDDLPLHVGRNTIVVQVTSPDGFVATEYPVYVDREPALAGHGISSGGDELEPAFASDHDQYVTTVGHIETPITFTPSVNNGETIEIRVNSDREADFVPADNGVTSRDLDLIAGTNTIEVRVKSPDYDSDLAGTPDNEKADLAKTYTFIVIRPPYLSDLTVENNNLKETFESGTLEYLAEKWLPDHQSTIRVTPTTTDAPVKLEIRANDEEYAPIDSGALSGELPMKYGKNRIDIRATSVNPNDDETYSTVYSLEVNRFYPDDSTIYSELAQVVPEEKGEETRLLVTDIIGKELTLSAVLIKPDGEKASHPPFKVNADGSYKLENLAPETYKMVLTVDGPNGETLAGHVTELVVDNVRGAADAKLIDPRSVVTDRATGKPLDEVKITLYWADTERNRANGRTPDSVVKLPALPNFQPHHNGAVQVTAANGFFGWVPFVDGDYYFIAEKAGYEPFDSREDSRSEKFGLDSAVQNGTMQIGKSLVTYNFSMKPEAAETVKGAHEAYMRGYPDGTFQPERGISRAELAAVLTRIIPADTSVSYEIPELADSEMSSWAASSINASLKQGWLKGYDDGTFKSEKFVTRAELSQVIYNIKSKEWGAGSSDAAFNDVGGHWAEDAIMALAGQGLITADSNGSFRPDDEVTRAEAVVIFNNLLERNVSQIIHSSPWLDVSGSYWAYQDIMEASVDHKYELYESGLESWIAD